MKILLILSLLFVVSCAGTSMPLFPEEIKEHYVVEVRDEEVPAEIKEAILNPEDIPEPQTIVRCLKFDIVNKIPYKIKFISEVTISECNMVGGYKPGQAKSLYRWIEDVEAWAQTKKKCFK